MNAVCTITTSDHMAGTLALRDSCIRHQPGIEFCVLVIDTKDAYGPNISGATFFGINDIDSDPVAKQIIKKYRNHKDKLRWCLKPVFLKYLITRRNFDKEKGFSTDKFRTLIRPFFIHVYHEFGRKGWDVWDAIDELMA